MKTADYFRKLANEITYTPGLISIDMLADILQTVYEAGAGDYKNEMIDTLHAGAEETLKHLAAGYALMAKPVLDGTK